MIRSPSALLVIAEVITDDPKKRVDPAVDRLAPAVKPILTTLSSLVYGVFEAANKAGDRHVNPFGPKSTTRHARLAGNAAFILCDFLVASHNDQSVRAAAKKAS